VNAGQEEQASIGTLGIGDEMRGVTAPAREHDIIATTTRNASRKSTGPGETRPTARFPA
jgi:hypothetical protein